MAPQTGGMATLKAELDRLDGDGILTVTIPKASNVAEVPFLR